MTVFFNQRDLGEETCQIQSDLASVWRVPSEDPLILSSLRLMDSLVSDTNIPERAKRFLDNLPVYNKKFELKCHVSKKVFLTNEVRIEMLGKLFFESLMADIARNFRIEDHFIKPVCSLVWKTTAETLMNHLGRTKSESIRNLIKFKCVSSGHLFESNASNSVCIESSPFSCNLIFPRLENPRLLFLEDFQFDSSPTEGFCSLQSFLTSLLEIIRPDIVLIRGFASEAFAESLLSAKIALVQDISHSVFCRLIATTGAHSFKCNSDFDSFRDDYEEYLGTCDCFSFDDLATAGDSKLLLRFIGLNDSAFTTIVLQGVPPEHSTHLKLLGKSGIYVAQNLFPELVFWIQSALAFDEKFCRQYSSFCAQTGLKSTYEKGRSIGETSVMRFQKHVVNFSPFVDCFDWGEALLDLEDPDFECRDDSDEDLMFGSHVGSCDSERSFSQSSNLTEAASRTLLRLKNVYPRRFKVSKLNVDKNGFSAGPQSPQVHCIKMYFPGDISLSEFLLEVSSSSDSSSSALCFHHGQGKIMMEINTVPFVLTSMLGFLSDDVLMWSSCRHSECSKRVTPLVRLEKLSLRLSFSRFLELMFYCRDFILGTGMCSHSAFKNHVRFFAVKNKIISFSYENIERFQLLLADHGLLERNYEDIYRQIFIKNVSATADAIFQEFYHSLSSAQNSYILSENRPLIASTLSSIRRHRDEFCCLLEEHEDLASSLIPIFKIQRDLKRWIDACSFVFSSLFPRKAACTCKKWKKEDFVRPCRRHRSRSFDFGSRTKVHLNFNSARRRLSHLSRARHFCSQDSETRPITVDFDSLEFNDFLELFSDHPKPKETTKLPFVIPQPADLQSACFVLPPTVSDVCLPIWKDELGSVIAFSLSSQTFVRELSGEHHPTVSLTSSPRSDSLLQEICSVISSGDNEFTHTFGNQIEPSSHFSVRHYFPRSFKLLRNWCTDGEIYFIEALARNVKWQTSGGKSSASFFKTLNDRFILKCISEKEFGMLIDMIPEYLRYVASCIDSSRPTALVKVLGIFEIDIQEESGANNHQFVVVMPNVLYSRKFTHVFDLKGLSFDRFVSTEDKNIVLKDGNFARYNRGFPLSLTPKSVKALNAALQSDTEFLSNLGIMDYSLLVAVDERHRKVVVGLIDYFRKYTIDKQLETRVKSIGRMFNKSLPTIVPPVVYRDRLLDSMKCNFMAAPSALEFMP
jgi:hypothetical protein